MRAVTLFAVLAAGLFGCGPGKELPDAAVKRPTGPQADPAPLVPPKSEDAAKKVIDAALRAASGGHVTRIERVKAFRSSAKGVMQRPVGGQNVSLDTAREFDAVWPNACRLRLDSQSLKPFTLGMKRPVVWMREGDQNLPLPDARHADEISAIDTLGQNWLLWLMPLTDPKAVAFDASTTTIAGAKLDTVKVSLPGYPVFALSFTEARLLVRIEYTNAEYGTPIVKLLVLGEHKPFDGIQLPTRIESFRNGTPVEQWTVGKWEVVEKMDETIFEQPK